jgi:hypothetical protein
MQLDKQMYLCLSIKTGVNVVRYSFVLVGEYVLERRRGPGYHAGYRLVTRAGRASCDVARAVDRRSIHMEAVCEPKSRSCSHLLYVLPLLGAFVCPVITDITGKLFLLTAVDFLMFRVYSMRISSNRSLRNPNPYLLTMVIFPSLYAMSLCT